MNRDHVTGDALCDVGLRVDTYSRPTGVLSPLGSPHRRISSRSNTSAMSHLILLILRAFRKFCKMRKT